MNQPKQQPTSRRPSSGRWMRRRTALAVGFCIAGTLCVKVNQPTPPQPQIGAVTADSVVFVNDTLRARVPAAGNRASVRYVWQADGERVVRDTTADTEFSIVFGRRDTGFRTITVAAWDTAIAAVSAERSFRVNVRSGAPTVRIMNDTTVRLHDTLRVNAWGADSNGRILAYRWVIDRNAPYVVDTSAIALLFSPRDTGLHAIRVTAMDDDSLFSAPDSMTFRVAGMPPRCTISPDTTVFTGDTMSFRSTATDSDGTVVGCIWALDSVISTGPASLVFKTRFGIADTGRRLLRVRAMDNDSFMSPWDTMVVRVQPLIHTLAGLHDTTVHVHDSLVARVCEGHDTTRIAAYHWRLDTTAFVTDTPAVHRWFGVRDTGMHTLRVYGVGIDGGRSNTDSMRILVAGSRPSVFTGPDTIASINRPVRFRASARDSDGTIVAFEWTFDNGERLTGDSTQVRSWGPADTGARHIAVRAMDNDSLWSLPAAMTVVVHAYRPVVTAMQDTTAAVFDTVTLHTAAADTSGTVKKFVWALDGARFADTTPAGRITAAWPLADTGRRLVLVKAIDDDGMESPADTIAIRIKAYAPVVTPPRDTAVFRNDTVIARFPAFDSNGVIRRYYAGYSRGMWADSSPQAVFRVWYHGQDTMTVWIGARDDDGILSADSFRVIFRPIPLLVTVEKPRSDSFMIFPRDQWDFGGGAVEFSWKITDTAGQGGRYYETRLFLSRDSMVFPTVPVYDGFDTWFDQQSLDTVRYFWRLGVVAGQYDTVWKSGSFKGHLQKRLGFVGHSIVVGYDGDTGKGGFRSMVRDSLRSWYGGPGMIKCAGPITTNVTGHSYLSPDADDSCLAHNGAKALDIIDSLARYPGYRADIWVLMIGVNESFYDEFWWGAATYARMLIDSLHFRNPLSQLLVVNGLPLPHDEVHPDREYNLGQFNRMLVDEIDKRKTLGWDIRLVDAFRAMQPDSVFPAKLFYVDSPGYPLIHPDQDGYDVIGTAILDAIGKPRD